MNQRSRALPNTQLLKEVRDHCAYHLWSWVLTNELKWSKWRKHVINFKSVFASCVAIKTIHKHISIDRAEAPSRWVQGKHASSPWIQVGSHAPCKAVVALAEQNCWFTFAITLVNAYSGRAGGQLTDHFFIFLLFLCLRLILFLAHFSLILAKY